MQTQIDSGETDALLLEFDRASDPDFDAIYHRHRDALLRYARRRHALDPEGVVDLALFDGYRAIDRLEHKNERAFWSYLYKAVNSHIAQEHAKPIPVPTDLTDDDHPGVGDFEADVVATVDLGSLLDDLPPDQRAVMRHRFIDGLSADQTAHRLGKTANAVRQLQFRGVRRLRRGLLPLLVLLLAVGGWFLAQQSGRDQMIGNTPADGSEPPATIVDSTTPDRLGAGPVDGEPPTANSPSSASDFGSSATVAPAPRTADPTEGPAPSAADTAEPTPSTDGAPPTGPTTTAATIPAPSTTVAATTPPPPATAPLPVGVIVLRAAHSDKCLEVPGGATTSGLILTQAPCDGSDHQRFRMIDAGEGYVELQALHSNKCLHVKFGLADPDTEIIHDPCTGSANAQFLVDVEADGGRVEIRSTGMCLDVRHASTADGANLLQSLCHTGPNQRFFLS